MTGFLILTTITVSLDSFFCGFSLAFNKSKKFPIVLGIAFTVFLMCLIANYGALFLSEFLTQKTACLGGIILIAVGIYNLIKKERIEGYEGGTLRQAILLGFAVGLDGALANLSLSLMGTNAFYVPVFIAGMHALTITLGILLAKTKLVAGVNKIGFLPPLVLILLGLYKVAGLFI